MKRLRGVRLHTGNPVIMATFRPLNTLVRPILRGVTNFAATARILGLRAARHETRTSV